MAFQKENEFNEKIKEHVKRILLYCEQEKIPVFMTFAVADDGKNTTYINKMTSAGALGIELSNDHLYGHALVTEGFRVVPPLRDLREIEEELETFE